LGGIDRPKSGPEFLWWLLLVSSSMQKTRLVFVLDEFDALVDVSPPRSKKQGGEEKKQGGGDKKLESEEKKQDFTNQTELKEFSKKVFQSDPYETQSPGERVEEFLRTLRAVHNNEMFEKFSLLGVGPLSILTIETKYLSP